MTDLDIIEFFFLFFVIGLIYSAIIAFVVQFLERIEPYFNNKPAKFIIGFPLAIITILNYEQILTIIYNFLPVAIIVGSFVGLGTVVIFFYIWYERQLEGFFISRLRSDEEKQLKLDMERRIQEWEKKEGIN